MNVEWSGVLPKELASADSNLAVAMPLRESIDPEKLLTEEPHPPLQWHKRIAKSVPNTFSG